MQNFDLGRFGVALRMEIALALVRWSACSKSSATKTLVLNVDLQFFEKNTWPDLWMTYKFLAIVVALVWVGDFARDRGGG